MNPTAYPPRKASLEPGVNDLGTLFPALAAELVGENPARLLPGSNSRQRWQCAHCGGFWEATVKARTTGLAVGPGCPPCSQAAAVESRGKAITLAQQFPDLAAELVDRSLVATLRQGSAVQVEWRCARGHVYSLSANQRVYGRGCPFCAFRKPWKGFNDLASVRPDLVGEVVHGEDLDMLANSKAKIEWKHVADDGVEHRWTTGVNERVYLGVGCAVCDGKQVQAGVNDFASRFLDGSDLEWGPNNTMLASEVSVGSSKKVEVVCRKHDEPNVMFMEAKFFSSGYTRCQDCIDRGSRFRSRAEEELCDFIRENHPGVVVEENVRRFRRRGIYELDIMVNESLALDFNGTYWHQEGKFKPVGYHAKKAAAVAALGFPYFVVDEADWMADKEAVLADLGQFLNKHLGV